MQLSFFSHCKLCAKEDGGVSGAGRRAPMSAKVQRCRYVIGWIKAAVTSQLI
jgi:hypothetical protein